MTAFFIPGITGGKGLVEDVYRKMRAEIELELGRLPRVREVLECSAYSVQEFDA